MTLFRIFLGAFLLTLVAYTIIVISNHGMQLFPAFFGAIFAMNWFGQFNLDFMGFLIVKRHLGGLAQSVQRGWFGVECLGVIWRHDIPPRLLVVLNGHHQWLYCHGLVRP